MKYYLRISILSGILLFITFTTQAQNKQLYAGTKTPYPAPAQKYTQPPAGFKPVFVNHVGRHGARFFTKAGSDLIVYEILHQAKNHKALTRLGEQLYVMTRKFVGIQKENYEDITGLGKEEQASIGKRMLNNYPDAFTGRGLEIFATHKIRTQQSATAFLAPFAGYSGKKQSHIVPDSLDTILRFYDLSTVYQTYKKSKAVKMPVDSLLNDPKTKQIEQDVLKRIFKPGYSTEEEEFVTGLYDMYCGQLSIPAEMKQHGYSPRNIDFRIAFEPKQLQWLDFINGAEDFMEKGAARDTLGIQATVAQPLLVDFLNTSAEIIDHKKEADAILRFTHAEAISPFATLLGLPYTNISAASIYQYDKNWSAESIIPLSANIQWIIYSNGAEYLVKVLLNEKEVSLPIPTRQWPYYAWDNVRAYYLKKLKSL